MKKEIRDMIDANRSGVRIGRTERQRHPRRCGALHCSNWTYQKSGLCAFHETEVMRLSAQKLEADHG